MFCPENQEIAEFECGYIADTQLSDGSWDVPWGWDSFPDVWAVSKNRIKSQMIVDNLLYLKGFGII